MARSCANMRLVASWMLATTAGFTAAHGDVPGLMSYQGRVTVSGTNITGTGLFRFALVDATGSATFWSNDGTSAGGGEPSGAVALPVDKGRYAVLLGDTNLANMTAIPASVFTRDDVRLRVWFDDGAHGSHRLEPDARLGSAGFALRAHSARLAESVPTAAIERSGQDAEANRTYVATNAGEVTIFAPATAAVGDVFRVAGAGAGGWRVAGPIPSAWTPRDSIRKWWAVASSADGSKLAAVVDSGRIYTSTNCGVTWTARESTRYWQAVASSSDGSRLAALVWSGRIYTSTNAGIDWTARESDRQWWAVASSADGGKLAAVVNGGQIYTSTNAGIDWIARESNRSWVSIASSADGNKLAALVENGRIYTSTDSGVSWTPRDEDRPWWAVASSADGSRLVAAVKTGRIYTSSDSGLSWTARENNRIWYAVASSADGFKLAAVDRSGRIYTSADAGATWTARESNRYWYSIASSADGARLVAVHQDGYIYTADATLLTGVQGTSTEFLYLGNGQWQPVNPTDAALSPAKIAGTALTTATVFAGDVGGTYGGLQLGAGVVDAAALSADAVTSAKIADGTISNADISATAAIAASKIADGTGSGLDADLLDGHHADSFVTTEGGLMSGPLTNSKSITADQFLNSHNTVTDSTCVAVGGWFNRIDSKEYATIGGGRNNTIGTAAVWSTIGGGAYNAMELDNAGSTIGGGGYNTMGTNVTSATISGGGHNHVASNVIYTTISGGGYNSIRASGGTIAGGHQNTIESNALYSTISGGSDHLFGSSFGVIAGGIANKILTNSTYAAISGGANNVIGSNAVFAIIAGGRQNRVEDNAPYALAAGRMAVASHPGAFVWADTNAFDFPSTAINQFNVRAIGGARFVSGINGSGAVTSGVQLAAGGGSWTTLSDANAKENFRPIEPRAMLEKVAQLPVREWNYKTQPPFIRHVGPTAQDFRAAFGLGEAPTGITGVDADGVALAAIQGLFELLKEKDARIADLEKRLQALEQKEGCHAP